MAADVTDSLRELLPELKNSFNIESLVYEPIELEDKRILIIGKVSFAGGGGGGGAGENEDSKGSGFGFGIGGNAEPIAILVLYKGIEGKEGTQLLNLRSKTGLGVEIFNRVFPMIKNLIPGTGGVFRKQETEDKTSET
ncbi:MAG: hypothetical protein GWN64_02655 [Candidatus Thorarchaeota archaeon]|nr:hypothetical protein [Candidatus Thorarchaeota archaeon]